MSNTKFSVKYHVLLPLVLLLTVLLFFMPAEWFGIEGLTVVQKRTIAIFIFAVIQMADKDNNDKDNNTNNNF